MIFSKLTGGVFSYAQNINVSTNFPYGMDFDYLDAVKPFGLLRTWIGSKDRRGGQTHSVNLVVNSYLSGSVVHSSSLITTFNEYNSISDDSEFYLFLGELSGFDAME